MMLATGVGTLGSQATLHYECVPWKREMNPQTGVDAQGFPTYANPPGVYRNFPVCGEGGANTEAVATLVRGQGCFPHDVVHISEGGVDIPEAALKALSGYGYCAESAAVVVSKLSTPLLIGAGIVLLVLVVGGRR